MIKNKKDKLEKRIVIKHGEPATALGKKIILRAPNADT
jgi:hypothetical protein